MSQEIPKTQWVVRFETKGPLRKPRIDTPDEEHLRQILDVELSNYGIRASDLSVNRGGQVEEEAPVP